MIRTAQRSVPAPIRGVAAPPRGLTAPRRRLAAPRWAIAARRVLGHSGANILTASRYPLGVLLAVLFSIDSDAALWGIVAVVCVAGLTDLLDGPVARRTGQAGRRDGAALDPLADDFILLTGLMCLVSASVVPLLVAALIFWVRASLVLVRLLRAVRVERYAAPRPSTRASMAGWYIGEAVLFAGYAAADSMPWLGDAAVRGSVLGAMSVLVIVAAADFVWHTHRSALIKLFAVDDTDQEPDEVVDSSDSDPPSPVRV